VISRCQKPFATGRRLQDRGDGAGTWVISRCQKPFATGRRPQDRGDGAGLAGTRNDTVLCSLRRTKPSDVKRRFAGALSAVVCGAVDGFLGSSGSSKALDRGAREDQIDKQFGKGSIMRLGDKQARAR
jgi:hypothetical protein